MHPRPIVPQLIAATLELGIIAYAVLKIRRAARALRGAPSTLDVPERIGIALHDAFPSPVVGRMLATELTLGWYALASWRRAPHAPADASAFTYHRKTGLVAVFTTLIAAAAVELAVVHLLVHAYSARVAWLLSAVSVVGIVWLIGLVRALVLRPVLLYPDRLVARAGVQWTAEIPLGAIESIETGRSVRAPAKGSAGYLRATPIAPPNVVLRLREEIEARGMYGRRRMVRVISLSVDEPKEIAASMRDLGVGVGRGE